MLNLKKILIICLLIVVIFTTISYAESVKVTEENLKSTFEKHKDSFASLGISSISVSNDTINSRIEDLNFAMKYDLTNNPIFTCEATINKGMTYDEFEKQTNGCGKLHMSAFIAVANIQGVELSNAMSYYIASIMNGSFSLTDSKYMIVDPAPGVTITPSEGTEIILMSEFGDKVMEYVNEVYKDKYTKTDNTYTQTIERKDVTDTSCKIVYMLEINTDALYSEVNKDGFSDKNQTSDEENNINQNVNSSDNNIKKEENQVTNSLNDNENKTTKNETINKESNNKNNSNSNTNKNTGIKLPQTGSNKLVLLIGIFTSIVIMYIFKKKSDEYNK